MATNQNSQGNQGSNQGQGQGSNQGSQGSNRGFGTMDDQQQRDIARKGGQTSANEQDRDSQGQFTGSTGSGSMGGPSGGQADRDQSGQRRDDQGQFTTGQQSGDRGGQGGSNR